MFASCFTTYHERKRGKVEKETVKSRCGIHNRGTEHKKSDYKEDSLSKIRLDRATPMCFAFRLPPEKIRRETNDK